jgi:hypothetical protein
MTGKMKVCELFGELIEEQLDFSEQDRRGDSG